MQNTSNIIKICQQLSTYIHDRTSYNFQRPVGLASEGPVMRDVPAWEIQKSLLHFLKKERFGILCMLKPCDLSDLLCSQACERRSKVLILPGPGTRLLAIWWLRWSHEIFELDKRHSKRIQEVWTRNIQAGNAASLLNQQVPAQQLLPSWQLTGNCELKIIQNQQNAFVLIRTWSEEARVHVLDPSICWSCWWSRSIIDFPWSVSQKGKVSSCFALFACDATTVTADESWKVDVTSRQKWQDHQKMN